eukprot:gene2835-5674_t
MYHLVLTFIAGFILGAVSVLLVAYRAYMLWQNCQPKVDVSKRPYVEPTQSKGTNRFLEQHAQDKKTQHSNTPSESIECVNILADFLFMTLRDTVRVKRQALKLLDRNLSQLLNKSSLGKICKRMKVVELNLGSEMPHLSQVRVIDPTTGTIGNTDTLDLEAFLQYNGKCNIQIEADLMFNRTATVSITVVEIIGKTRFSFRTEPHPHWTFGFCEGDNEPLLDLSVEALFEKRMFQQLGNMVAYQIRAALRKFHTIPAPDPQAVSNDRPKQRMRYDPFFTRPLTLAETAARLQIDNQDIFTGRLTVEVIGCRDLKYTRPQRSIYVTLALFSQTLDDENNSSEAREIEINTSFVCNDKYNKFLNQMVLISRDDVETDVFEVLVYKAGAGATIGVYLDDIKPRITGIRPGTPASGTDVRINDVITAVNGIAVMQSRQTLKLIKESNEQVKLRISRPAGTNGGNLLGRYSETRALPCTPNPTFREVHTFVVTPSTPRLYIRVYDCKSSSNPQRHSKRFLIGYSELDLEEAALFCVANQAKLLKLNRLQLGEMEGSPDAGFIKLLISHTPVSYMPEGEDTYHLPYFSQRPRIASMKEDTKTTENASQSREIAGDDYDDEDVVETSTDSQIAEIEATNKVDNGVGAKQSIAKSVLSVKFDDDMFSDLEVTARRTRLEELLNELERMLQLEADTRRDIEQQMKQPNQPQHEIQRLKENLCASDSRRDLLHHRTLKCASAIISCEEELSIKQLSS